MAQNANQGILEFVEMFKAPIKMLHPLLTATQEGNYIGTENIGAIPFGGIILAHSNEAEWQGFKANKKNEAFIDRVCMIKVPYCLRATEEQKIYEKLIAGSELAAAPCAPATLETLARFSGNVAPAPARELDAVCLLPVISFGTKKDGDTEKKHDDFVARMLQHGYTERQVRRLVEWYMRVKQAG